MTNKNKKNQLDDLIRQSMQLEDTPSAELNCNLKANLYQHEAATHRNTATRFIPLWYLPMILNIALFALIAGCAILLISNPYISIFVSGICGYIGLSGIVITVIGIKRTTMKETMSIHIQKRGVIA